MSLPCLTLILLAAGCQQTGSRSSNSVFSSLGQSDNHPAMAAVDMQLAFAQTQERNGQTQKAIDAYQRLAKEKNVPQAMHRLGVLHDKQGNFEQASEYYDQALKLLPKDANLLCDIGYSYYLQENYNASETHLRRALKINPSMERANNNLGLLLARTNQQDAALAAFRNAAPNDEVAIANFNSVFPDNQQLAKAKIAAKDRGQPEQLVNVQPKSPKPQPNTIKAIKLECPTATTDLARRTDYELPPAEPSLIVSEELEIKPVALAHFSKSDSNPGPSIIQAHESEMPAQSSHTNAAGEKEEPVVVEIPSHWFKYFPEK